MTHMIRDPQSNSTHLPEISGQMLAKAVCIYKKLPTYPGWMGLFPRQNAPWTKEEVAALHDAIMASIPPKVCAVIHGRMVGAIMQRAELAVGPGRVFRWTQECAENDTRARTTREFEVLQKRVHELAEKSEKLVHDVRTIYHDVNTAIINLKEGKL